MNERIPREKPRRPWQEGLRLLSRIGKSDLEKKYAGIIQKGSIPGCADYGNAGEGFTGMQAISIVTMILAICGNHKM